MCREPRLGPGHRFLHIGAGGGALLVWTAQHHGVRATGIALSRHQHAQVSRMIDGSGLRSRVGARPLDCRGLRGGEFERVASVGLFERVHQAQMKPGRS